MALNKPLIQSFVDPLISVLFLLAALTLDKVIDIEVLLGHPLTNSKDVLLTL